jgi:hypothetical protein
MDQGTRDPMPAVHPARRRPRPSREHRELEEGLDRVEEESGRSQAAGAGGRGRGLDHDESHVESDAQSRLMRKGSVEGHLRLGQVFTWEDIGDR